MRGKTVFEECLSVFDELRGLEQRSGRTDRQTQRARPALSRRVRRRRRALLAHHRTCMHANDIYTLDYQVGTVLGGLGFQQRGLGAQDRRVLRRLADAHRARQAAASRNPACCCSTNPPTTSTSKPATGSRTTSAPTRTASSSSRTTATSSTSPSTKPSSSGTSAPTSTTGNYEKYVRRKRRAQAPSC